MLQAFVAGEAAAARVRTEQEPLAIARARAAVANGEATQDRGDPNTRDRLLELVEGVRRDRARKLTPLAIPVVEGNAWLSMGRRGTKKRWT